MSGPELLEALRAALAASPPEIVAAYLYGSRARGSSRPGSDVDLAILVASRPAPTLAGAARNLEATLEAALRLPVEVVVLNTASADLSHRVRRDGVILLDRDRAARLRFEVQSRNEYFDLEPVRRRYRRLSA